MKHQKLEDWQIGSIVVIQCMGHPKDWRTVRCSRATKEAILKIVNSTRRAKKDFVYKW